MKFSHWVDTYRQLLKDQYKYTMSEEELEIFLAVDTSELYPLWNANWSPLQAFKKYIYNNDPDYYEPPNFQHCCQAI